MSSFSNMVKSLEPANTEDIQAYRSWLEKHAPIESAESRFLERKDDLLTVAPRRRTSSAGGGGGASGAAVVEGGVGPHQRAAVGLPLIAVLPLMSFGIVPGLLGRLFVLSLIGAGEVLVVTSSELMELMSVREWFICASM
jgi:hypothetical protein